MFKNTAKDKNTVCPQVCRHLWTNTSSEIRLIITEMIPSTAVMSSKNERSLWLLTSH